MKIKCRRYEIEPLPGVKVKVMFDVELPKGVDLIFINEACLLSYLYRRETGQDVLIPASEYVMVTNLDKAADVPSDAGHANEKD